MGPILSKKSFDKGQIFKIQVCEAENTLEMGPNLYNFHKKTLQIKWEKSYGMGKDFGGGAAHPVKI